MNSFNHYSFGAVGYWFYTGAAGIQLDDASPGYKHFFLAPQFTNRLTYVKATLDSPYGKISSYWHVEGDQMIYDVTVPPNSSATLEPAVSAERRDGIREAHCRRPLRRHESAARGGHVSFLVSARVD